MRLMPDEFINFVLYIVPVLLLWIRVESRLSKMEGRLDLLLTFIRRRA